MVPVAELQQTDSKQRRLCQVKWFLRIGDSQPRDFCLACLCGQTRQVNQWQFNREAWGNHLHWMPINQVETSPQYFVSRGNGIEGLLQSRDVQLAKHAQRTGDVIRRAV